MSAFRRLRREDHRFEASLGYIVICLRKEKDEREGNREERKIRREEKRKGKVMTESKREYYCKIFKL